MNKIWKMFLVGWIFFLLSSCAAQGGVYTLKLVDRGELRIHEGDVLQADIILLDGSLVINEDGHLQGNIYQVLGTSRIDGQVTGNVSQWGGEMALGSETVIEGTLSLGGGDNMRSPRTRITDGVTDVETQLSVLDWVTNTTRDQVIWAGVQLAVTGFLAVLIAKFIPRPLSHVRGALKSHIVVSLAMGILVGLVGLVLMVQMVFTIILIPVAFLGGLLFLMAVLMGWVGIGDLIGRWVWGRIGWEEGPVLTAGVGTLIFLVFLQFFQVLPGPGGLITLFAAAVGLGAVFLTRFGLQRFIPAYDDD